MAEPQSIPAAFTLTLSSKGRDLRVGFPIDFLFFTESSLILQEHPGTGLRHLRQSPKRDHAYTCHQCTYRNNPWATLFNGLWRAPVAGRPRFPDATRILARKSPRVSRWERSRHPLRAPAIHEVRRTLPHE